MTQQWDSIEEAAEDLGISERTAWRWLKKGKIRKVKNGDGDVVFVASSDISTDNDNVTNVTGDNVSVSVVSKERVSSDRKESGQTPVKGGAGLLVQSLKDELEADRVAFEIEKLQDARTQWEERRDRERKEKLEQERMLRLEEVRMAEEYRQREEEQRNVRHKIQVAKKEACEGLDEFVSPHIFIFILQEIEKAFSKMRVEETPLHELIIIAEGVRDKIIMEPPFVEEVRKALSEYLFSKGMVIMKRQIRALYQESVKQGFKASYRDWIIRIINYHFQPEDHDRLLELFL